VTVNSKEENSQDFCPNYVEEFSLWTGLHQFSYQFSMCTLYSVHCTTSFFWDMSRFLSLASSFFFCKIFYWHYSSSLQSYVLSSHGTPQRNRVTILQSSVQKSVSPLSLVVEYSDNLRLLINLKKKTYRGIAEFWILTSVNDDRRKKCSVMSLMQTTNM
jgi:hypothetical protein